MPIVPMNLHEIIITNSAINRCHDHSNYIYERNVSPKYPKINASAEYPRILKANDVAYLDWGDRLYQEYFDIIIPAASKDMIPERWNLSDTAYER